MKKVLSLFLGLALLLSLTSCYGKAGQTDDVIVEFGESELYTRQEIATAVGIVKTEFVSYEDCVLHSLSYAGDEVSQKELEHQRSQRDTDFSHCIVLDSSFHSPKYGGGAWNADFEYEWIWIIVKEAGGDWYLLDRGIG